MQTWASFIRVFYFFFHKKPVWLDQVLVKFLIYHIIIVAASEIRQSSDLMQLVPELSGHLQMWCIIKQIVFFRHGFGETETIIHCVCAPFNNDAMPHVAVVSGVRWSCQAKSSPGYISTHTHIICHPSFFFRRWETEPSSLIPLHQPQWFAYYVQHRWRVGHTSLHTSLLPHW